MKRCGLFGAAFALGVMACGGSASAQSSIDPAWQKMLSANAPGGGDNPLTGRYEGSIILGQTTKAFDEITLADGRAEGATYDKNRRFVSTLTAQGKVTRTVYLSPLGRSSLEVFSNYRDAVTAKGFAPAFECAREACGESFTNLKYSWDRKETHVLGAGYEHVRQLTIPAVFNSNQDIRYALMKKTSQEGDSYVAIFTALQKGGQFGSASTALSDRVATLVEIVEPRAMDRRMITVKAEEIAGKISAEGRAVFYGILFDFDKADIKAESEPQLAEMARFLKTNPAARVFVIGHTDNKGALEYNLGLSGRRAAAVVKALSARHGVDAKRMTARGLGPLSPVASNRSEDGQAKNRRVEMVEQ